MVTCLVSIPLQLSVKVKGRRMLKAVTMANRRIELQGLGFEDSRRDKPIFRSEKNMSNFPELLQHLSLVTSSFVVKMIASEVED